MDGCLPVDGSGSQLALAQTDAAPLHHLLFFFCFFSFVFLCLNRYVSPVVASDIVQRHLLKGELIPGVWRGQMGMSEEEQKTRCGNCSCEKTEL